jgi:hypothetical protein
MKYFKIVLIATCFSFLFSCSKNTKETISDNGYIINLDSIERVDFKMSSLFKSPKTIILETTDETLIAKSDKIYVVDDYIIIMDKERANRIFVFDKNGKFLHKIGSIGGGPGEYRILSDFTVDSKNREIYLLTDRNKVIKYRIDDGFLLNSFVTDKPEIHCYNIQYRENKLYSDIQNFDEDENKCLVQEIDAETGKQISTFLSAKENYLSTLPFLLSDPGMYYFQTSEKEDIRFFRPFMNTIFSIEQGKTKPYITLQGKDMISTSDLVDMENSVVFLGKLVTMMKKYYHITNYIEFSPYIWLTLHGSAGQPILNIQYNKETETAQQVRFINDCAFKEGFGVYSKYFTDSKGLYGLVDTDNIPNLIAIINNDGILPNLDKVEKLKELKGDSNPVIFYYEGK